LQKKVLWEVMRVDGEIVVREAATAKDKSYLTINNIGKKWGRQFKSGKAAAQSMVFGTAYRGAFICKLRKARPGTKTCAGRHRARERSIPPARKLPSRELALI
jgi:hypothetical protein